MLFSDAISHFFPAALSIMTKIFITTFLLSIAFFGPASAFQVSKPARRQQQSALHATLGRREALAAFAAATTSAWIGAAPALADSNDNKVLVLGGTGLVGSRVVKKLKSMNIDVIATSRDGRDGTVAFDVSKAGNVATSVESLAKGCTAVISTIGTIGTDKDDVINAATGLAAGGAKAAGVKNFVYISVAPEVRELAKGLEFLNKYMTGKQFSEESITSYFKQGESYTLIEPTFIYGGDKFAVNPPRVAGAYGKIVEAILSSAPLRAATNVAPEGFIKIALEPPVAAEAVADAAIAGALGKGAPTVLDTYDKIQSAARLL